MKTAPQPLPERIVSLAYKLVPLPSGCSNCWGDLGEGCSDECRRSSDEHSKKIDETVKQINLLLAEVIDEVVGAEKNVHENGINIHLDNQYVGYNQAIAEIKLRAKEMLGEK